MDDRRRWITAAAAAAYVFRTVDERSQRTRLGGGKGCQMWVTFSLRWGCWVIILHCPTLISLVRTVASHTINHKQCFLQFPQCKLSPQFLPWLIDWLMNKCWWGRLLLWPNQSTNNIVRKHDTIGESCVLGIVHFYTYQLYPAINSHMKSQQCTETAPTTQNSEFFALP